MRGSCIFKRTFVGENPAHSFLFFHLANRVEVIERIIGLGIPGVLRGVVHCVFH